MTFGCLLKNVLLHGEVFTFWALNLTFWLQFISRNFLLGSSIFHWIRFEALFEQFYCTFTYNQSHNKKNSDRKQQVFLSHRHSWDILKKNQRFWKDSNPCFGIGVDINLFTTCFFHNKLYKANVFAIAELNKSNVMFLQTWTFTCFFSIHIKMVHLSLIGMWLFWNFIAKFLFSCLCFCQKVLWQVFYNQFWLNNMVSKINSVCFLTTKDNKPISFIKTNCFYH